MNKNNRNSSELSKLYTETIHLFQGHMHIFLIFYCLYYKKCLIYLKNTFKPQVRRLGPQFEKKKTVILSGDLIVNGRYDNKLNTK